MKIENCIIIVGNTPIEMTQDELRNFKGNLVLTEKQVSPELIELLMSKFN